MGQTNRRIAIAAAVGILGAISAAPAAACGPFATRIVMSFTTRPDSSDEEFVGGRLGILRPMPSPEYLYIAYRHLSGLGLALEDREAILESWRRFASGRDEEGAIWQPGGAGEDWSSARTQVQGAGPPPKISPFGQHDSSYTFYPNCPADAFRTAARTLGERIATFGADSPQLKDWVEAQDQVFANCAIAAGIPGPAKPGSDPLVHADRAYQTAAAHFYAGEFETAETLFRRIAQDPSSPWREVAPYLVARTLVRKGTLRAGPGQVDMVSLAQADNELHRILSDKALAAMHPAASRLRGFVRFRLHPNERVTELGRLLVSKRPGPTLAQDLRDYHLLIHRFEDPNLPQETLDRARGQVDDDLTDWLLTFSGIGRDYKTRAVKRWSERRSLPWLVVSLAAVDPGDPRVGELLRAADAVNRNAPGYTTVQFYGIRLMIESGRPDQARKRLDAVLGRGGGTLPESSRNLFLALRVRLARNMDEFLRAAPRKPVALVSDEDGVERRLGATDADQWLVDRDFARIVNHYMPLARLVQAVTRDILPAELRRELTQVAWVRAMVLENEQARAALVPILRDLWPHWGSRIDTYVRAPTKEARRFIGALLILESRGMGLDMASGGRERLNSFDANWWCARRPPDEDDNRVEEGAGKAGVLYSSRKTGPPMFLRELGMAAAKEEQEKLGATPAAPSYLAAQVIRWAQNNPTDPLVPESLHLVVQATRYGCRDENVSKYSKQAFRLLHKRYPKSPWSKRTPYWY